MLVNNTVDVVGAGSDLLMMQCQAMMWSGIMEVVVKGVVSWGLWGWQLFCLFSVYTHYKLLY